MLHTWVFTAFPFNYFNSVLKILRFGVLVRQKSIVKVSQFSNILQTKQPEESESDSESALLAR